MPKVVHDVNTKDDVIFIRGQRYCQKDSSSHFEITLDKKSIDGFIVDTQSHANIMAVFKYGNKMLLVEDCYGYYAELIKDLSDSLLLPGTSIIDLESE